MVMKKEQLQQWMREHDMPDEWWYSVNGIVGDAPVPLSQALAAGKGGDLQLCHASRADENDWWKVSAAPRAPAPPPGAMAVAEPDQEPATAERKQHVRQSMGGLLCFLLGLFLSVFLFPIGLLFGLPLMFGLFAQKRTYSCTACGNALVKTSEVCPACRAKITGTKTRIMDVIMIGVVIFIVGSIVLAMT